MAKVQSGDVLDLLTLSKSSSAIGEVRSSLLTLEQFQTENLGDWMLMDGSSCIGTAYHSLTGNETVPNAVTEGTFLRQAKSGRSLGTYEADALQGHYHTFVARDAPGTIGGTGTLWSSGYGSVDSGGAIGTSTGSVQNPRTDGVNGTPRTANETRSKNTAVNFFIKVGY